MPPYAGSVQPPGAPLPDHRDPGRGHVPLCSWPAAIRDRLPRPTRPGVQQCGMGSPAGRTSTNRQYCNRAAVVSFFVTIAQRFAVFGESIALLAGARLVRLGHFDCTQRQSRKQVGLTEVVFMLQAQCLLNFSAPHLTRYDGQQSANFPGDFPGDFPGNFPSDPTWSRLGPDLVPGRSFCLTSKTLTDFLPHLVLGITELVEQMLQYQMVGHCPGLLSGADAQAADCGKGQWLVLRQGQCQGQRVGLLRRQGGAQGFTKTLHGLGDQRLVEQLQLELLACLVVIQPWRRAPQLVPVAEDGANPGTSLV